MKEDSAKNSIRPEDVRRILGSPEGQKLLSMLRSSGSMQEAATAVQQGRVGEAQAMLRPLMEDPEAAALLQKLNGK